MMTTILEAVQPVLASRDVEASITFYERLGFSETFRDQADGPRYAGVARDGVELHLQWHDETQWAASIDRPVYRFVVRDVDAPFAEFVETGGVGEDGSPGSPWGRPGDTPWGTREFHLRDPDGNGLHFYRDRG
ncbi:MAG: VOC family protein [Longimicrobiales bacterium]|nr:VOC family protein [Longimicrobiales bacterium]